MFGLQIKVLFFFVARHIAVGIFDFDLYFYRNEVSEKFLFKRGIENEKRKIIEKTKKENY